MEVVLLRHAESTANINPSECRRRNVPLSPHGEQQAANLSGDFDIVFCSPLRRTRQTLDLSGIRYRELIIASEVREIIDFPSNLLTDEEVDDNYYENYDSITDRCTRFFERLQSIYEPGRRILVVSHGMFLHQLTGKYADNTWMLRNAQMVSVTLRNR